MASFLVRTHDFVGAVLMFVFGSLGVLLGAFLAVGALIMRVPLDWLSFVGTMGMGLLLLWVGRELLKRGRTHTE